MAQRFLSNIRVNDAYTLPASDGSNGQVIVTDGSGNLAFADPSTSSSASVIYRDNFTGDGSTVAFTLQNSLSDEDQTFIYIDGVYQEKDNYSLSDKTITFTTAPESGHSVEVISISGINVGPTTIYQDNFTGDGLSTEFNMAQSVDNEVKTMIYFNGVYQFKGTYTVNGSLITFDTAPANDVAIEVISIASAAAGEEAYSQELLFYGKASEAISKGDAVMFAGSQGDHFLFAKATQAAIEANHEYLIGLATQDLATNEYGYVTEFGSIVAIDTDAYEQGDILWFDAGGTTAGALTITEPAAPLAKIQVAAVIRKHQNEGVLFVRPTWYHELGELHDVNLTSVTDKDILAWNNTQGYWENTKTLDSLTANTLSATTLTGTLSTAAQTNITSVGTLTSLDVSGAISGNSDVRSQRLVLRSDALERWEGTGDDKAVSINYFGYNTTFDYYRDLNIYNGKGGFIATFDGSSGNVGINRTTPSYKLDVGGGSAFRDTLRLLANDVNAVNLSWTGSNTGLLNLYEAGSLTTQILASGNSYFNGGNVGIGTSSPSTKLQVNVGGNGIRHYSDSNNILTTYVGSNYQIFEANNNGITSQFGYGLGDFYIQTAGTETLRLDNQNSPTLSIKATQGSYNSTADLALWGTNSNTYGGSVIARSVVSSITDGTAYGSKLRFYTTDTSNNLTKRMVIASNGDVGIGISEPQARLEVNGGSAMTGAWQKTAMLNATYPVLMFNSGNTNYGGIGYDYGTFRIYNNASTSDVTATSPIFNIMPNGNVGIKTTTPDSSLEVEGDISLRGSNYLYFGQTSANIGSWQTRQYASSGKHYFNANAFEFNPFGYSTNYLGVTITNNTSTGGGYLRLQQNGATAGLVGTTGSIQGDTTNELGILAETGKGIKFYTNGSPSPVAVFGSDSTLQLFDSFYTTKDIRFNGTGLNASDKKLYSSSDGCLEWFTHNFAGTPAFAVSHQGTKQVLLSVSGNSYLNGGNVGINTTSPGYTLDVNGSFAFRGTGYAYDANFYSYHSNTGTYLLFKNDAGIGKIDMTAGDNISINPSGGNVGIGHTSPKYKLDVSDSIRTNDSVINWYQSTLSDGVAYVHLKTNLWAGGGSQGNTDYTMSLFSAKAYFYSPAAILEGNVGFHNWSNNIYNTVMTGNIWSSPYVSSDGYVVLVIATGSRNYGGITIDWHQSYQYPFRTAVVTTATTSSSATGAF